MLVLSLALAPICDPEDILRLWFAWLVLLLTLVRGLRGGRDIQDPPLRLDPDF